MAGETSKGEIRRLTTNMQTRMGIQHKNSASQISKGQDLGGEMELQKSGLESHRLRGMQESYSPPLPSTIIGLASTYGKQKGIVYSSPQNPVNKNELTQFQQREHISKSNPYPLDHLRSYGVTE